jgi:hypothetical protein
LRQKGQVYLAPEASITQLVARLARNSPTDFLLGDVRFSPLVPVVYLCKSSLSGYVEGQFWSGAMSNQDERATYYAICRDACERQGHVDEQTQDGAVSKKVSL